MPLPWSSKSDKGKNRRVAGSDEPHSSESTEAALSSSSSSSSTAAEKKSSLGQPPPFEDPASYSYDYSHHVKASAINHPNAPTSASSSSLSPNPPSSIRHSWDGTSSKQTQSTNLYAAPGAPVNATYIYTGPGGTVVSNGPIPSSSEPTRKESKTIRTINRMERRLQQSIAQAEQAILGPPPPRVYTVTQYQAGPIVPPQQQCAPPPPQGFGPPPPQGKSSIDYSSYPQQPLPQQQQAYQPYQPSFPQQQGFYAAAPTATYTVTTAPSSSGPIDTLNNVATSVDRAIANFERQLLTPAPPRVQVYTLAPAGPSTAQQNFQYAQPAQQQRPGEGADSLPPYPGPPPGQQVYDAKK